MSFHAALRVAVTSAMIGLALLVVAYRRMEQCCSLGPDVAQPNETNGRY